MNENDILGDEYAFDSKYVARCRKLQSLYRYEIGEPIRPYVKGSDSRNYGNYISGGEESGANFLEKYIFEEAQKRIQNKQKYETINADRLYNNLLSSQPMAFNLFYPLKHMLDESQEAATRAIKAALPMYPIHKVTEVGLEFIPDNYKELTGDKSAMDAIIRFQTDDGRPAFIAIETKYSENLGTNQASDKTRTLETIRTLKCFKPDIEQKILDGSIRLTQIYRNFLLSESLGNYENTASYSLILAPAEHPSTAREVASLYDELRPEYKEKIISVSLEDFIARLIDNSPEKYRNTFEKFRKRYLDFSRLTHDYLDSICKDNERME